jgi:hypothetical protein
MARQPKRPIDGVNLQRFAPPLLTRRAVQETAEEESDREMDATRKAFQESARKADAQFADATDGEFYTCVVFQTKAQREEFWRLLEAQDLVDEEFVDGLALARLLKLKLTAEIPKPQRRRPLGRWQQLVSQ